MGVKIEGNALLLPLYCSFSIAAHQTSTLESVIHGHPIYKQIWWLLVWEVLTLEWEGGNNYDKFAVSLLKVAAVIGHVPVEFPSASSAILITWPGLLDTFTWSLKFIY